MQHVDVASWQLYALNPGAPSLFVIPLNRMLAEA
jgi:hypothetical protein